MNLARLVQKIVSLNPFVKNKPRMIPHAGIRIDPSGYAVCYSPDGLEHRVPVFNIDPATVGTITFTNDKP